MLLLSSLSSSDDCWGSSLIPKRLKVVAQSVGREETESARRGASERATSRAGSWRCLVREKVVGSDAKKRRSACRGGRSLCKSSWAAVVEWFVCAVAGV